MAINPLTLRQQFSIGRHCELCQNRPLEAALKSAYDPTAARANSGQANGNQLMVTNMETWLRSHPSQAANKKAGAYLGNVTSTIPGMSFEGILLQTTRPEWTSEIHHYHTLQRHLYMKQQDGEWNYRPEWPNEIHHKNTC